MPKPPKGAGARNRALTSVRRRLMSHSGITSKDLRERWTRKFGAVSATSVSKIISGEMRSLAKELDLAELLGVPHAEIFAPMNPPRRRDLLPGPDEIGPYPEPWETE